MLITRTPFRITLGGGGTDLPAYYSKHGGFVLAAAINKAGSTDPTKIREAILATKKFPGAEGEYNFDQNGDGLHGYNVVKNDKGNIVFDKHIEFND